MNNSSAASWRSVCYYSISFSDTAVKFIRLLWTSIQDHAGTFNGNVSILIIELFRNWIGKLKCHLLFPLVAENLVPGELVQSFIPCMCIWDGKYLTRVQYIIHYKDAIMGAMAFQITSLTVVYSTVDSGANQRKHQSSASLALWIPRTNCQ